MASYYITKIQQCSTCEGSGMVEHPAWAAYWKEQGTDTSKTQEQDRKWMEEHGWINRVGYRQEADHSGMPHEEITCRECNGDGCIESQVNLAEVLPEIIAQANKSLDQVKQEIAKALNAGTEAY